MIRCTCCQAELNAPEFFNGSPYGSTCVKKVDPSRRPKARKYIAAEAYKIVQAGQRSVVNVKVNGKWEQRTVYGDVQAQTTSTYMQDGVLYVAI